MVQIISLQCSLLALFLFLINRHKKHKPHGLLKDRGLDYLRHEVYASCVGLLETGRAQEENIVKKLFEPFTDDEISEKIAEIIRPSDIRAEVQVVYQTVENLHKAIPNHSGDWYFTGDYPTNGGNRVVNRAFMNFYEGKDARAY